MYVCMQFYDRYTLTYGGALWRGAPAGDEDDQAQHKQHHDHIVLGGI